MLLDSQYFVSQIKKKSLWFEFEKKKHFKDLSGLYNVTIAFYSFIISDQKAANLNSSEQTVLL